MKEVRFSYGVQTWRGQVVIRLGPSRVIYRLFFNLPADSGLVHYVLDHDIIKVKQTTAFEEPCPDKKALERGVKGEDTSYLKPDEKGFWNPTKDTPARYFRIELATAVFYVNEKNFKKFLFKGKKLKGLFILTREDTSSMFILKRSAGPGGKL